MGQPYFICFVNLRNLGCALFVLFGNCLDLLFSFCLPRFYFGLRLCILRRFECYLFLCFECILCFLRILGNHNYCSLVSKVVLFVLNMLDNLLLIVQVLLLLNEHFIIRLDRACKYLHIVSIQIDLRSL